MTCFIKCVRYTIYKVCCSLVSPESLYNSSCLSNHLNMISRPSQRSSLVPERLLLYRFTHFRGWIGRIVGRGRPFGDIVLTFIPTLYQQQYTLSKQIKGGRAILLWAYLRDHQLENTTSQSSVGVQSVIVSCQTSKVHGTASHLTFSPI